jgi:site-specific DNA-methyltransferase (adenine-specific)
MKNGFARGKRLYPAHYALLYFTKGNPNYFNRPKIPTPRCRHCGEFIKDYGGYKSFVQDGINLSDVWDDISPVRHSKYKHRASNELPLEIPRRVIKISGYKDGILVDPFSGTGSSIIEALNESMFFLACDREKESIDVIRNRLCDY